MSARDDILSAVRRARAALPSPELPVARPIPARAASLPRDELISLFVAMAEEAQASVARVGGSAVPAEVQRVLAELAATGPIVMAPDPALDAYPWQGSFPVIRRGRAAESDAVGITGAFAGIAETGTLMLLSGPMQPATLHLLPETHIVILPTVSIVATLEDAWGRLRAAGSVPRAVTCVTGPSRTADIEQRIELGAHGPRRLHIVLVDPDA